MCEFTWLLHMPECRDDSTVMTEALAQASNNKDYDLLSSNHVFSLRPSLSNNVI